jgi:hypothetical protein
MMGRPRKMTVEQMISVVDSYYLTRAEGSEKLMKCSLIAAYAVELGYRAEGYDFARNLEVREYIEQMKCYAEVQAEFQCDERTLTSYKSLDVAGFIRSNKEHMKLTQALTELDAYWKRVYEQSEMAASRNRTLMREKAGQESAIKDAMAQGEKLKSDNAELSVINNKLITENRYLRKMLRLYLYPAIANEMLLKENALAEPEARATEKAVDDMAEFNAPLSLRESVANDMQIQAEENLILQRMWGERDE